MLALLWSEVPLFQERRIHAFAYGAPCSVCHEISQQERTKKHVTSIVIGDDIVSRLSLSSFKDLQRALIAMSPSLGVGEKAGHDQSRRPDEQSRQTLHCWNGNSVAF